jgi:hypothetical protein
MAQRRRTKAPTPLSTRALAAYLTWKQLDVLATLRQHGALTPGELAEHLAAIVAYDERHGGTFYTSASVQATSASLRTLEQRGLVVRHDGWPAQWTTSARAESALDALDRERLYVT